MRGIVKGVVGWTLGLIQKGELRMRKSIVFTIAFTIVAFAAGEASAAKLTEQQVRNTCGKKLQEGGGVIGCSKKCGKEICDYSCGGPEGKGCRGHVVSKGRELFPEVSPGAPGGGTFKQPAPK